MNTHHTPHTTHHTALATISLDNYVVCTCIHTQRTHIRTPTNDAVTASGAQDKRARRGFGYKSTTTSDVYDSVASSTREKQASWHKTSQETHTRRTIHKRRCVHRGPVESEQIESKPVLDVDASHQEQQKQQQQALRSSGGSERCDVMRCKSKRWWLPVRTVKHAISSLVESAKPTSRRNAANWNESLHQHRKRKVNDVRTHS